MGENTPMRFLSPEWLEYVGSRTAAAAPGAGLCVHQRVSGGPDGEVAFTMRLAAGAVTFQVGPAPIDVDITLSSDYQTAAAISQGLLTPAAAFAAGQLRVGGAINALAAHQDALADIGTLLAGVAEATTY